jgi:acetoin utilization deacetylase AcuC-like enzyme
LELSASDFEDLAAQARAFAPGPGRLALVLEGGYDLGAITRSTGAVLAGLLGESYRPEPPTSGGPGKEAVGRSKLAHLAAREAGGYLR